MFFLGELGLWWVLERRLFEAGEFIWCLERLVSIVRNEPFLILTLHEWLLMGLLKHELALRLSMTDRGLMAIKRTALNYLRLVLLAVTKVWLKNLLTWLDLRLFSFR